MEESYFLVRSGLSGIIGGVIINLMHYTVGFISSAEDQPQLDAHSLFLAASFGVRSALLFKRDVKITAAYFESVFFKIHVYVRFTFMAELPLNALFIFEDAPAGAALKTVSDAV